MEGEAEVEGGAVVQDCLEMGGSTIHSKEEGEEVQVVPVDQTCLMLQVTQLRVEGWMKLSPSNYSLLLIAWRFWI